jgi:hypothetical protein
MSDDDFRKAHMSDEDFREAVVERLQQELDKTFPGLKLLDDPPHNFQFPLTVESVNLAGEWCLVSLTAYIGNGKYQAFDEDGQDVIVDWTTLGKVSWSRPYNGAADMIGPDGEFRP